MRRNSQKTAFLILIPMLVFTFITTVRCQSPSSIDDSKQIIYDYFTYRNNNDFESIKNILLNPKDMNDIKLNAQSLEEITLINIYEESNQSIIDAYLKNNISVREENLKIYKVKYRITYSKDSISPNESGVYESWYFITRQSEYSDWLIDIGAI